MSDEGAEAAEVAALLPGRAGHFLLESGHHGELWLELERLCLRVEPVRRLAKRLAAALAPHGAEVVCGPLVEGAFVALLVAESLAIPFTYSEPRAARAGGGLFPVAYALPPGLRAVVAGRRVAVVNDVINAGSAVRGTLADLQACGARPAALATLAVLGAAAPRLAADAGVPLVTLATLPNTIWEPEACPLCARGVPLTQRAV